MERENGIPINLISRESLVSLGSEERVDFVLNEVKAGKVLILEMGLSAVEEASLIEHTMKEIDHETFIGIEIQSYSKVFSRDNGGTWLDRLLKRKKTPRMAVIGPASLLRTIHKDGNVIQTMLVTREHVIENAPDDNKPIRLGGEPAGGEGVLPEAGAGVDDEQSGPLEGTDEEIEYLHDECAEEMEEEDTGEIAEEGKDMDEEIEEEDTGEIEEEGEDMVEEIEEEDAGEIEEEGEKEEVDDEPTGGFIDINDIMEDYGVAEGGN